MHLPVPAIVLAACLSAGLCACARVASPPGETVLLDEVLPLSRGESVDTARREVVARSRGTCVAIVEEADTDVSARLEVDDDGAGVTAAVEVESLLQGGGIEVAAIAAAGGARVALVLTGLPHQSSPGRAHVRIQCYADEAQDPGSVSRAAAYRAWSDATRGGSLDDAQRVQRERLMDIAIGKLGAAHGDPRMAAWARLTKSVLVYNHAHWRDAVLEAAAAERAFASLAVPEPRGVARARYHKGSALIELVNDGASTNPTAAQAAEESRRIFTELAADSSPLSALERARSVNYLGVLCYEHNDNACALRQFEEALARSRVLGHHTDELRALQNLGAIANEMGDYVAAARYYDQVLPRLTERHSMRLRAAMMYNAGLVSINLGQTARAIERFLVAHRLALQSGSKLDLGRAATGLGQAYWRLGDLAQAEVFFAEALAARRVASDATGMLFSLRVQGMLARDRGDIDTALALHREAVARSTSPDMVMRSKLEVARDYAAAADHARAIAACREALAIRNVETPAKRAEAELALAEYLLEGGKTRSRLTEARRLARAALSFAIEKSDVMIEVNARHVHAAVLAQLGDTAAARAELEIAIALILDFRGMPASPELQSSTLAHEQATFRDYVDLSMRDAVARGAGRFAPVSRAEEDALRVLELTRAADGDAARDQRTDPAVQARIDDLLQRMAGKRVRMAALNDRVTAADRNLQQIQYDIAQLRAEIDRLRRDGAAGPPAPLAALSQRPWPPLAAHTVQLSYAIGRRHAYIWKRDADGLSAALLATTPAHLERALAELQAGHAIRDPERKERALATLSRLLLPPGVLDARSSAVEVVGDSQVAIVPFAALTVPLPATQRLVETHEVRLITSLFGARTTARPAARRLDFVGVPSRAGSVRSAERVFPGLSATRAEARAIAALVTSHQPAARVRLLDAADGDAAVIRKVWSEGVDVLHFATHGLTNLGYPSASLLLLPARGGNDDIAAYLTAGQVQEWRGDARLVFLGACETAAAVARFGEGMPGLPRSFLRAGARNVIATLWPVEDVSEHEFTIEFYRRFLAGGSAASALAQTQRSWLASAAQVRSADRQRRLMTAWAHALYASPQ